MFISIVNGIVTGALISICSFGTIFIMLIKLGLQKGFKSGALFEIGHLLSIICILSLVYLGIIQLENFEALKILFCFLGSASMLVISFHTFKNRAEIIDKNNVNIKQSSQNLILSGFLLNIINPFEFLLWFGVTSSISLSYGFNRIQLGLFILFALFSVATLDLLKVLMASKINAFFSEHHMRFFNIAISIILLVFGLFLFIWGLYFL